MGRTALSREELKRVEVMSRVASGAVKLKQAAELIGRSYRQVKRIWAKYREGGPEGLKHGNAGRGSNRAKPEKFRQKVLRLVEKKYSGSEEERFGPTLAAEHLGREDGLEIDAETLRRWMLEAGLWSRQRKRKRHRERRPRKGHFGELVQMDGSFYQWLEGRSKRDCLLNMVDDATGTTLCRLGEEETTWLAADVLRAWVEKYGVPRALYVDWKNVYQRVPTEKERERDERPVSQFGRMCAKLGIELIGASSPQAKGRVERNHGVHQDRLVKKMRRKRIRTLEQANGYLEAEYLPEHNQRFAREAAQAVDFHWEAPADLDGVFCLEQERVLSEDWVVRYRNRWLQVQNGEPCPRPGSQVRVCEYRDGSLHLFHDSQELRWREIAERPQPVPAKDKRPPKRSHWKPPSDHPWRRSFPKMSPVKGPEEAVEMTGCGKPTAGFPQPLENAGAFPTFPPHDGDVHKKIKNKNNRRWKSGKPTAGFSLSRRPEGKCSEGTFLSS